MATDNALPNTGRVMESQIVLMVLTKKKQPVSRVPLNSSARMADASTWKIFVTERMIASITATKTESVSVSH